MYSEGHINYYPEIMTGMHYNMHCYSPVLKRLKMTTHCLKRTHQMSMRTKLINPQQMDNDKDIVERGTHR